MSISVSQILVFVELNEKKKEIGIKKKKKDLKGRISFSMPTTNIGKEV